MISAIVAIDSVGGIGINNGLPWPFLSADMKWFKQLTTNNIVIMGGNTWSSLPKKLPNRVNVVISKKPCFGSDHSYYTPQVAIDNLNIMYPDKEIYIIGGQQLYDSCMDIVDKFFITEIDEIYPCDRFFDISQVKNKFPTVAIHNTVENTDTNPRFTIKEYKK